MAFFKSLFGNGAEDHEKRAREYMASGHWGEARLELGRALQKIKDPDDPRREEFKRKILDVTHRLAKAHEEEGDDLEAEGLADEAAERYQLALTLVKKEEDRKRLQMKLAHEAAPACAETEASGRLFLDTACCGASAKCAVPAPEALEGDPMEYFEVLMHTLEADRAEEFRSLGENFALAYAYANHGEFPKAIKYFEKAVQDHPDQRMVHKEFGRTLLCHKESKRAAEELRAARNQLGEDLELAHLLASAYVESDQADAALEVLTQNQASFPGDLESRLMLGDLYMKKEQMDEANQAYEEALSIVPEFPETLARLGACALKQGDDSRAIDYYSKAVETSSNLQHTITLAELHFKHENLEEATELYHTALHNDLDNRWWYMVRIGEIFLKSGLQDKGLKVLKQARAMIPQDQEDVLQRVDGFLQARQE